MFKRSYTTSNTLLNHYARSIINPNDFKLSLPLSKFQQPKSVLVFATPNNLPSIIQHSINLHQQHDNIQLIIAGTDTILNERNGVSELWLDEKINITNSILLDEKDQIDKPPPESDGLNIVTAKNHWINLNSKLTIDLNYHHSILDLNLANTVFTTGKLTTLYYFDVDAKHSGEHLCDLEIKLPKGVVKHPKVVIEDQWVSLFENLRFEITSCVGNLIKTLDGKPASKFLEDNPILKELASKETEVYAKIDGRQRFKVVAGGGGWGAKANMIALSNEAKLTKGSQLEFFMIPPESLTHHKQYKYEDCMTFSSSPIELGYSDNSSTNEKVFENVFGCGSEKGFFFNGTKHNSSSETIFINI